MILVAFEMKQLMLTKALSPIKVTYIHFNDFCRGCTLMMIMVKMLNTVINNSEIVISRLL